MSSPKDVTQPSAAVGTLTPGRTCVMCDGNAVYQHNGDSWCELCACERASRTRGEAAAGLEILATTVRTLRVAGLSDKQIIGAAREAISRDKQSRQWSGDEEFLVADWQYGFHARDDERFQRIGGAA